MADNVAVSSTATYTVSSDEAASGQVQRVKLTYSGDGLDTHVTADASGLLVNLGSNNDVVASGTVSIGGTPTVAVSGTVTSTIASITAGDNVVGRVKIGDGTDVADMLGLTNGTAVAVGVYDSDGSQISFAAPVVFNVTATNGTAVYAVNDTIGGQLTLSDASTGSGKTGHVISAVCHDPGDQGEDVYLWLFDSSVTPSSDNAAFALSDGDLAKTQGVIQFTDWFDAVNGKVSVGRLTPVGHPLHYVTAGAANLYAVAQSQGTATYGAGTALAFELHCLKD